MRILIAEDEIVSRRLLAAALTKMGHEVVAAANGAEAWEVLQGEDIGLVIADWMMPEVDGLELVRRIRTRGDAPYTYVILLTSRSDMSDLVAGMEAGADDYIRKPFHRDELMVRIKAGQRVITLERELALKNKRLDELAKIDGLTGLYNRRSFDEDLANRHDQSRRFAHAYSLAMIDIDHFKAYNDLFGHEAGDNALRTVARALRESTRAIDRVYRYGGEEFVVLLLETRLEGALVLGERLRQGIEDLSLPHPGNPPAGVVTISIGVATYYPSEGSSPEEILRSADQALYQAKEEGRNRLAAAANPIPEPATAG